jgi:ABC-type molybdate transport system substrate-binding protein
MRLISSQDAVLEGGHEEAVARNFVEFLWSPAAQAIFVKHGFTIAPK